jgi:hypothetical protein
MIWLSTTPERFRMKKLTDLMNLIAAAIRLIDAIIRTGWV